MMYSSMNLQAMYTGVISKYIQNSSLKVFEEVLVFFFSLFFFFFFFFKKLYSYSKPERKMSCIFGGIANSKSRVPLFHLLYNWSPDYTWRRGNWRAELVIQYSHLPLEEEQGCPRYTRPSPNMWPATPQRSLIMTRWQMKKLHKKKKVQVPVFSHQNSSSVFI